MDILTGLTIWSAQAMTLGLLMMLRWLYEREDMYLSWGCGFVLHGLGVLLVALRGSIPDVISIEIANTIVLAGMGLWVAGLMQFDGRRVDAYVAIPALIWVAGMFLDPVRENFANRAMLHCLSSMAAYGMLIHRLLAPSQAGLTARKVMAGLMGLQFAANAAVAVMCLGYAPRSFADASKAPWLFIPTAFVFIVCIMAGAKMLANRAEERLKLLADSDPLTGALNRRGLFDRFRLLQSGMPEKPMIALLHFDLDYFKQINDRHGHQAGDAVLVAFARIGQASLRGRGPFGRMGGEEFASVLRVTDLIEAAALAEAIRTTVKNRPITVGDAVIPVTVSIGISLAPAGGADLDTLLTTADRALYAAKHGGRDRTAVGQASGVFMVPSAEHEEEEALFPDASQQVTALRKIVALGG